MAKTMKRIEFEGEETERIALVKLLLDKDEAAAMASLGELELLCKTAGGEVAARFTQSKDKPDPATYIGSGKVFEIADFCRKCDITLVVFDCELSPSQIKNLEDGFGGDIRVIDRSMLILDIFALHATTGEGKLQVELAQLKYTAPRLIGKGLELSRQGGSGSIAARGPGESKLETDRRYIKRRIASLESQIAVMEKNRETQRSQRMRSGIPMVTIAGYTNAGKSTLLNYLTGAGILAENKLFATLDPTTRRLKLPDGKQRLLTDTVGFIRNLPHQFIKAFRSTLDEVKYSDVTIVLMDASDRECTAQARVTTELLHELNATDKPILYVFNKCDKPATDEFGCPYIPAAPEGVSPENVLYISARTGEGVDKLLSKLAQLL
ncbi:MAG: GTPase HflX [Clostridia bacterium]|nr:GTPase HflX [Clostridia bacterium]